MVSLMWAALFLAVVWAPRLVSRWRWQTAANTAQTWLLVPQGARPDDLDKVGRDVSAAANQLKSRRRAGMVVHRFRDDHVVRLALTVYGHDTPQRVAEQVATAVHATLQSAPSLEFPSEGARVWQTRRGTYRGRPAAGELPAPSAAADWLSEQLRTADDDTCVSAALEPVSELDFSLLRRWYMARAGRADDMEGVGPGAALRCSVVAFDPGDRAGRQTTEGIAEQLHRWPFNTGARPVTSTRTLTVSAAACAIPGLIGVTFAAPAAVALGPLGWLAGLVPVALLAAAAVAGAAAVAVRAQPTLPINRAASWVRGLHRDGLVPVQRVPVLSAMRIVRAFAGRLDPRDHNPQAVGRQRSLGYPYRRDTLVVSGHQAAMLVALPGADDTSVERSSAAEVGASAALVTMSRDTPAADASLLGNDQRDLPVRIHDKDRKHGVFIAGEASSGKSVAVTRLFQQDAAARLDPARPRRGRQCAMVWFETKGEGADDAERALQAAGYGPDQYVRLDLNATGGWRLELLDRTDPHGAADRLVGALTYAFETGAIGPRAAEALQVAFALAMQVTPQMTEAADLGTARVNVLALAALLMAPTTPDGDKQRLLKVLDFAARTDLRERSGDDLDPASVEIAGGEDAAAAAARSALSATPSSLFNAVRAWSYYERSFGRRTWAEVFESPRNKVAALARTEGLWTPSEQRPELTFPQLLDHHGVVIVNTGSSPAGQPDDLTRRRLAAITLYLLWQDIQRTCVGWLHAGRSVGLYADELAALSGTGSGNDVIRELRDLGRSYGVQPVFATQRVSQLPERTAQTVAGFGNRLYFQTESLDAATAAAEDLNGGDDDGRWSPTDLRGLQTGQAITRLRLFGAGQPPFVLNVALPDGHRGTAPPPPGADVMSQALPSIDPPALLAEDRS